MLVASGAGGLEARGIGFDTLRRIHPRLIWQIVLHIPASVAQFERQLLIERTMAGLAVARAEGKTGGPKRKMTPQDLIATREHMTGGLKAHQVAKMYGGAGRGLKPSGAIRLPRAVIGDLTPRLAAERCRLGRAGARRRKAAALGSPFFVSCRVAEPSTQSTSSSFSLLASDARAAVKVTSGIAALSRWLHNLASKRCVYSAARRVSNGSKLRSSKASVSVPELHSHSTASGSPFPAT